MKDELLEKYGEGKTIFMEYMNDLFADGVDARWIKSILAQCRAYPKNVYVFQSKNPKNAWEYRDYLPPYFMIGTTIETNREHKEISNSPDPYDRATGIAFFQNTFLTVEPILDFDLIPMMDLIKLAHPGFVNIGADSKKSKLPEPSGEKVRALIAGLQEAGIEIRQKSNLARLLK
jgi:protein gp37